VRGSEFADLKAFAAIAEQGNFTRAARKIGVSPSALSQTIRDLEARLGVRLFNRTTRSVAPTEAGKRLLARIRPLFLEFDNALDEVGNLRDTPAGTLRICADPMAMTHLVQPILPHFQTLYPDIALDLSGDDTVDDIFARGFDAGIQLLEHIDKDLVAVRVGPDLREIAIAAPSYLAKHGRPETPHDLQHHVCINWRQPGGAGPYRWRFARDGESFSIAVNSSLLVDDCAVVLQAALDGLGITVWMEDWMRPELEAGRLVPLLQEWSPTFPGFHLYHPSRRQIPATLRAFIAVLRDGQT
jgi:DNA-binding transcriptional LysR family regulator